jgi:hypothetical protein
MITFSFSVAPFLRSELEEFDKLRVKTLLTLLPIPQESEIQWEMFVEHILLLFKSIEKNTTKKEIEEILRNTNTTHHAHTQQIVLYRHLLTSLYSTWFMNSRNITLEDIKDIYHTLELPIQRLPAKEISVMLNFVQTTPEHPVLQSALIRILTYQELGRNEISITLSNILSWIMLVKNGYDFRRLLVPEAAFSSNFSTLYEQMDYALSTKNISQYLEYYVNRIVTYAEELQENISKRSKRVTNVSHRLSERQNQILTLLQKPGSTITNRHVQKLFGVSQVTASRDLSSLLAQNLLFKVGKGRSARYTKM